jgi:UDP-glucuronate decarboxylase
MSNILITGGAGNIASTLAEKLAMNPANHVVIVDNLSTGCTAKVPRQPNVTFIKGDTNIYSDIVPIFGRYAFDYVFHYAAVVGVQRTLKHPIWVLNDIEGIKNILSLSKSTGVKRVFYSSSSEVYGEPFEIPQNERTTPLNSRLPYAVVKNVGEAFFKSYYQEYGLEYTIFRFFNTYGPNQSQDFVIPRFIKAAQNNSPITVFGDGCQTRTFCYIDDNVDACIKAMNDPGCTNKVINIGNDKEVSIIDLAHKIIELTQSESRILHLPPLQEGDMTRRCPDVSIMKKILGRDLLSLEEGIKKMLTNLVNQPEYDTVKLNIY